MRTEYLRHEYTWSNHCITGNTLGWGITSSSIPKDKKMLKELEDKAGLIERQKQGQGKPTKIYVKDFATGLHDYGPDRRIIQTHENHDSETNENHESRNVIITGPDSWKSCTNNTNYNNTDFINTNPINLSAESAFIINTGGAQL